MPSSASRGDRDRAAFESLAAEILEKIKGEADPSSLNAYRALFRKRVPFFMRSYVGAYLLMSLSRSGLPQGKARSERPGRGEDRSRPERAPAQREDGGQRGERKQRADRTDRNDRNDRAEGRGRGARAADAAVVESDRRPEEPRRKLPDDEASTLFVSAGRNRRVYARDLLALLANVPGVDRDDVGELRILDNFSFVQVRKAVADEAISALDGREFRGRPLSVSYAKPRKDEPAAEAALAPEDAPLAADEAADEVCAVDEVAEEVDDEGAAFDEPPAEDADGDGEDDRS